MDLSWLASWLDSANTFFQYIWDFMAAGIYEFFKDALVIVTKALIYSYLQFKVFMLDIALTVVKEIAQESGVVSAVQSAWGGIPGDMQSMLAFFKIPQGLTLIFSAIPARWAMKFIPGVN